MKQPVLIMSNHSSFESIYIKEAKGYLHKARNAKLDEKERQLIAVQLAACMLNEALNIETLKEKKIQKQLARMMKDAKGKAFTTAMTDECFRSSNASRVADQLIYLLKSYGIPSYLSWDKRMGLKAFEYLGKPLCKVLVPMATWMLRKETSQVILPGEKAALSRHMHIRREQNVRLNINHLGEAILGEKEALRRLNVYLHDLTQEDVEYVSVKISTIFSQINLLGWEATVEVLASRLRELYRVAKNHYFVKKDGSRVKKFVNLDMEEYKDLILTKDLFKKVLSEEEFMDFSAGIVLQAYLPDSFPLLQELTDWAKERKRKGGAPIKVRIVKGANLAMEQFEASLRDWPQAPYKSKSEVDANYKRMVSYACQKENAEVVNIGVGSHNLFDIAYAMLLRAEHKVEHEICFEMLEGMADHMRKVVQTLSGDMLLYCPVATKEDFQSAVAYLIRRLDENTGPENFLRHTFGLKPGTTEWEMQVMAFQKACDNKDITIKGPRRNQNRYDKPTIFSLTHPFENEADTDFSLPINRKWAKEIAKEWENKQFNTVPLVINGKEIIRNEALGEGHSPAKPREVIYHYSLASWNEVDQAISCSKNYESRWSKLNPEKRAELLCTCAHKMREKRAELLGVMLLDGGKSLLEADPEISEAIDFAEYYARSILKMSECKDIEWKAKGTILITPPWNFPVSISAGGIFAALAAGNCVIYKPARESILSGWILANCIWEAGVPKEAVQFVVCADESTGSQLIKDTRLNGVILTGATSTAKLFKRLRYDLELHAETGGKNAMIITALSDRDLAIKDLIMSAFGHSGQKCSAASLAILEKEVYNDPHFLAQLKDAVESLKVGSPFDFSSKVVPLIRPASGALLRGFTDLDEGEEWLVKPKQDPNNPNLWSPGVRIGVKEGSFMHTTELFGPVLGIMKAENLEDAIRLANATPYGLTAGLQSLDKREQDIWIKKIEAGNCYINRTITGAIVRRQPFGGCKASSFGNGAKAGGPNYVAQFASPKELELPHEKSTIPPQVAELGSFINAINLTPEQLGIWYASLSSYAYHAQRLFGMHDPSLVVGQDNLFTYRPHKKLCLRLQKEDKPLDVFRVLAAALYTHTHLEVSYARGQAPIHITHQLKQAMPHFHFIEENEESFIHRMQQGSFSRVRHLSPISTHIQKQAGENFCHLDAAPVLSNGRFELLHYVREVVFSIDYHRYGNLMLRENEKRKPVL